MATRSRSTSGGAEYRRNGKRMTLATSSASPYPIRPVGRVIGADVDRVIRLRRPPCSRPAYRPGATSVIRPFSVSRRRELSSSEWLRSHFSWKSTRSRISTSPTPGPRSDGRPPRIASKTLSSGPMASIAERDVASAQMASAKSPLRMREVDGKAWIVSARTSTGTRARIARTHSWIAAEASGQAIAAPTRVRDRRSTTIVTWPRLAWTLVAPRGRREVRDELDRVDASACACSTLIPTNAASGSV